jgi:hypothetical protein
MWKYFNIFAFQVSEYIRNSAPTASTKRRYITRNESCVHDNQELQYVTTSIKKLRIIEKC